MKIKTRRNDFVAYLFEYIYIVADDDGSPLLTASRKAGFICIDRT